MSHASTATVTVSRAPGAQARALRAALWITLAALLAVWSIRIDALHAQRVAKLSSEGTPRPTVDPTSSTGYVLGQRHFVGTHERGETYRWIAATQHILAEGVLAIVPASDTIPTGRVELGPRLYSAWLAACAWGVHVFTGEPLPLAAEEVALWEPVISHAVALAAAIGIGWACLGLPGGIVLGLLLVFFPPVAGQFLPGTLTPRTWALLLGAAALMPVRNRAASEDAPCFSLDTRRAACAAVALWLSPAVGVPVILAAAAGALGVSGRPPVLRWAIAGAVLTLMACLIDRSPWDLAAGELRFVHPLYALAWLGLGLVVAGWRRLMEGHPARLRAMILLGVGIALTAVLVIIQLNRDYAGWLYPAASLRRLTSLDETHIHTHALAWLREATLAETLLILAPVLAAILVVILLARRSRSAAERRRITTTGVPLLVILVFGLFRIRLAILAALIAVPLILATAPLVPVMLRRIGITVAGALMLVLMAVEQNLPPSLSRSRDAREPGPADLQALVDRHIARWMATHHSRGSVAAMAPPELSDALVFHGGLRTLMSTAWESYPGQVAASRILSAPEASEAEAVIESRGITHIILPSWDRVIPLLVREPLEQEKTTLFARLDRWKIPAFLRPVPYHLPPAPGYAGEKLAIFKVVPHQDEALLLSRLAEYFVEMNRSEPAALAAKVLAEVFADEPDAAIARALVRAHAKDRPGFDRELERVVRDVKSGRVPIDWDRRVARAIVLGLGRRDDLARAELEACLAQAGETNIYDLTALEAFRLLTLVRRYHLTFPNEALPAQLASVAAEYNPSAAL